MGLNRGRLVAAPFVVIGALVGLGALADWCLGSDAAPADAGLEAPPAPALRRVPRATLAAHFGVRLVGAEITTTAPSGARTVRAFIVATSHDRCVHHVEGELRLASPDGTELARVPVQYENASRACQIPIPDRLSLTSGFSSSPALLALVDAIGKGGAGVPKDAQASTSAQWIPSRVDDEIAE